MIFLGTFMKYSFFNGLWLMSVLILVACSAEHNAEDIGVNPVAKVQTQPLVLTDIAETITAYGPVIALPNSSKSLSVPYASRMAKVYVSSGEAVHAGESVSASYFSSYCK